MTDHFRLTPTELRLALREGAGYHPVPVSSPEHEREGCRQTAPMMKKWETVCLTASPTEIERWARTTQIAPTPGCSVAR